MESEDPKLLEFPGEEKLHYKDLTREIIGAAIDVHRTLGPGLLESVYEECLCHEMGLRGLHFERQIVVPITYKGVRLESGHRLDIIVEFLRGRCLKEESIAI